MTFGTVQLPAGRPTLDVAAAALYLGVSPRFVRAAVQERRIAFHKIGRFVRFSQADLDAFVAAGRVEPWQT